MKIAITGASGFVGQHVLQELQLRDVDILVASRSSKYPLIENARTKIVVMDIAGDVSEAFTKMGKPDVLIHLAWDGLPNYQADFHVETELPLQQRFLDTCIESGLKRLVITGTCFEYGKVEGQISESVPTHPCTQYGRAKDALRKHLEGMKPKHSFQLAWLRLFYLYGPGQSKNSLYTLLTNAVLQGDTKFDMSGGEQERDFLPVREASRIIANIALLPTDVGMVNVCSGTPITVRRLVEAWIKKMNSDIKMNLGKIPYSDVEPMSFWGDRTKLDALMGAK